MIEAKSAHEWVVRLQDGEDLVDAVRAVGHDSALILTGIGMVREAKLGYWNGTEYEVHACSDPAELISLQGNLALDDAGQRIVHAHLLLSGQDGLVRGGHLVRATVHNTIEIGLLPLEGIALERRLESNGLLGLFPRTRVDD
jgi:predicted DNA-binding protein with PD1-like motif